MGGAARRRARGWRDLPAEEAGRLAAFARFAAGERLRAERLPVEVLLERAIAATGYDVAILARSGGDRRLANLRKLMRLAREYERAEGRDLRGFLAYAVGQDLAEAREGEAALESEGLDAVRLMTIHRAKGLEFPVVCVADLGRPGRDAAASGCSSARDGTAGLKLATLAGGDPVSALGYDRIADQLAAAEAAEERRLLYVAATRAEERLILAGGVDPAKWPAPRPGGPPIAWLGPALLGDPAGRAGRGARRRQARHGRDPRPARHRGQPARRCRARRWRASAAPAPAPRCPPSPKVVPSPGRPQPAQRRLSYTSLQDYARCPYRFYLSRVLGLPRVPAPPPPATKPSRSRRSRRPRSRAASAARSCTSCSSGSTSAGRRRPARRRCARSPRRTGSSSTDAHVADMRAQVAAFAASPLCARLAAAGGVRREAGFAFELSPGGGGPLVSGFVDVLARERTARS